MTASETTLPVPTANPREISRSPSPVLHRQPSRSPQPYHSSKRDPTQQSEPYYDRVSVEKSRAGASPRGGSESGTEADDELTKRLPAPPGRRRISSDDDLWNETASRERGRTSKRGEATTKKLEKSKRVGIAIVRRGLEIGLSVVLVIIVLFGKERRAWKEVLLHKGEILYWLASYTAIILSYPLRVLLRGSTLQRPRSLDPSPILYPILFPVLIALSLTPQEINLSNPFLLANLVISLSNIPPTILPWWDLRWVLSLLPLIPSLSHGNLGIYGGIGNTLALIPPINATLTSALTGILHPSLTSSELRLLSAALINLLYHASSPQAIILRAIMWGGGISLFLLSEDVIRWNVSLARVPLHRFKRAGHTVIGIERLKTLVRKGANTWKKSREASDSEADIAIDKQRAQKTHTRHQSSTSFYFTGLTAEEANTRRMGYAAYVYILILSFVFLGLRPYIGKRALDGVDPFLWAPGYIFCGQSWYQRIIDHLSPGSGYCFTAGSVGAADTRLLILLSWAGILISGLTLQTLFAARFEVDTRRKVFHGMVILMFLVTGLIDPPFTHLCLSLAIAIFLLVDLVRAGQLPPVSGYIARFLEPYVDNRDLKGPMVVSHVFLLLGTAVGWWLTLAGQEVRDWDWSHQKTELSFSSGVACVGLGDAAASLIGRRYGRTKWGWKGGKSVEGSVAFAVAVTAGLGVARWWIGGGDWGLRVWIRLIGTACWGSLLEAVATGVNDNVVVPLGVWAVVRGVGL
ncbi:Similar to Uncharacterized membrane protein C63.10c; acc. no. Q9Y7T6 [Pyronema omphalodes CBS 100304]|uniref:dolichol kinase n=1 Tax=Pyronema omphalodes (strain CBS 100304) TaxID=1076935 RepID=U4LFB2_PYROM|nr:Similar to Uncharacterized membrane protein C63.10c; acc. no. Q9Y7T6 [Pyronema omphalodes CBS 100304]